MWTEPNSYKVSISLWSHSWIHVKCPDVAVNQDGINSYANFNFGHTPGTGISDRRNRYGRNKLLCSLTPGLWSAVTAMKRRLCRGVDYLDGMKTN